MSNSIENMRLSRNLIKKCYETPNILKDVNTSWFPTSSWIIRDIITYMQKVTENDLHSVTKEELVCAMEMDSIRDADTISEAYESIIKEKPLTTIERREILAVIKRMRIKDTYMDAIESYSLIKDSNDIKTLDEHLVSVRDMFIQCEISSDSHRLDIDSPRDITLEHSEYITEKYGLLNKGYEKKTLSIYVGPSNSGKSIFLCNEAAYHLSNGYNVLFISLEMSPNSVAKRINQNRFNMTEQEYYDLVIHKDRYMAAVEHYKKSATRGNLQIVELPTGEATADDIEFEIKSFESIYGKLDVLIVDYIQIMKSKGAQSNGKNNNMYESGKQIASSLRALAMKYELVAISAAQTNRDGLWGSNPGQSVIAESAAIYHTCDNVFLIGIDSNDRSQGELIADKVRDSTTKGSHIKVAIDYSRMKVSCVLDEENVMPVLQHDDTTAVDENGGALFGLGLGDDIFNAAFYE